MRIRMLISYADAIEKTQELSLFLSELSVLRGTSPFRREVQNEI
jgi:hypothetical protein